MTLILLPQTAHILLSAWAMFMLMLAIYEVVYCALMRLPVWHSVVNGAAAVILFVLFRVFLPLRNAWETERLSGLRAAPFLLLLCILTVYLLSYFWTLRFLARRRISADSVREAFDTLPTGLCYYWPDGMTMLVNSVMEDISISLTGQTIMDANRFREELEKHAFEDAEGRLFVRTKAGRVFSFSENDILLDGYPLLELIAADVTEEYRIVTELRERRRKAEALGLRLKMLSGNIKVMTMEKEALQAKVRIHDELGRLLLVSKRYLLDPSSVNPAELVRLWKLNMHLLKDREYTGGAVGDRTGRERAAALGVHVEIEGEMPQEAALVPLLDAAISVHATNLLRHAQGNRMKIESRRAAGRYVLTFTNNGTPPEREVRETGSLADLRRQVEGVGGTMKIESSPVFRLILELPEQEGAEQDGI